jgi:hypothetical protein
MFKGIKDARQQAAGVMGAGGLSGVVGGGDIAAQAAYAQLANKLGQVGVEAPGVIHAIRPGESELGGSQKVEFGVTIKPSGGEPYETTITQSMLPAQLEGISEGAAITVKYDPDSPTSALIYGW